MTNGFNNSFAYRCGYIDRVVENPPNPTYNKGRCKFYGPDRVNYFAGYNDASIRDSKVVAKAKSEKFRNI